jgi:hypothetical protein
MEGIF